MNILENFLNILPTIFYKLVYMSILASVVGVVIIIINNIFKNKISPKWKSILWLIFIIMLILPINLKTPISIYNILPKQIEEIDTISRSVEDKYQSDMAAFKSEYGELPMVAINQIKEEKDFTEKLNIIDGYSNSKKIMEIKRVADLSLLKNIIINYAIPIIWFFVSTILTITYVIRYIEFSKKVKNENIKDDRLKKILFKAKVKYNIKRKINIVNQEYVSVPSIFGLTNIRILINEQMNILTDEQVEHIFMHELAHYKRKDNILNVLVTLLKNIYFFNPIIIILINNLRKNMEASCDEIAVKDYTENKRKEYLKTLVNMTSENKNKVLESTLCITDDKSNLESRINMVKLSEKFERYKILIGILSILIICVIVPIFCTTRLGIVYKVRKELESRYSNIDNFYLKETKIDYINDVGNNPKQINEIYRYQNKKATSSYTEGSKYIYRTYNDCDKKLTMYWNDWGIKNLMVMYVSENQIDFLDNLYSWSFSYLLDGNDYNLEMKTEYTETVYDGNECYLLSIKDENIKSEIYIDKNTYLPLRSISYNNGEKWFEYIYEIKINNVNEKDIVEPNLEEMNKIIFSDDIFDINSTEKSDNLKAISNTNKEPGEDYSEKFVINENEELDVKYFSTTDDPNIRYIRIQTYETYKKISDKFKNIKKLTEEDFIYYDTYFIVNMDKNKTMDFKERVDTYTKRNIVLDISERNENRNEYSALLFITKKENEEFNIIEGKNEIKINSEEYTLKLIEDKDEKITEYLKTYTGIQEIDLKNATGHGGYLKNIIPNEFYKTEGRSISEIGTETRTCWEENLSYTIKQDEEYIYTYHYIDAETGELIAAKIEVVRYN